MKRYKVERKRDGKWEFVGVYSEKYIPQLVNASICQAKKGYRMYHKLRITEEVADGSSAVL